jgi:single-stranded-DNA-specific exonuclease
MMSPLWRSRDQEVTPAEGPFPPLIGHILASRGFAGIDQIDKLLFPKLTALKDPLLLQGMGQAVARLGRAALNKEKICIYADFDLDGTSGLALLKTGLLALGFEDVVHYQPKRLSEGYGFHAHAVEELHKQGVSLIVTVDVGITANPAVEKAQSLGVDVILTDHHLPGPILPPAFVILNPNQGSDASGLGYLCGAGVAFYLLRALKRYFFDHPTLPKNNFELKEVLDFFTIATLTDMVPLLDDNRVLVKHGLLRLAESKRPGLRALLVELGLDNRALTSQDVAIRFAPKLNALSRMESGVLPIDLFLVEEESQAKEMVRQVLKNNSTRVQLQSDAETEAMDLLKNWSHKDFVFVASRNFHRGIVGLIATKLSQVFNRPAFVGAWGEDNVIVGSARLPAGQEACLVEALNSAKDLLNRFGGHSAASGFELHGDKLPAVMDRLDSHFFELHEKPKALEVLYDVEARLSDVGAPLMKWYDFVGPFGTGFSTPLIHFQKVILQSKKSLKGGHWRLRLMDEDRQSGHEALLFSPSPRHLKVLTEFSENQSLLLDVLGELQWNYFAGQKSVQILVRDLKPSN